MQFIVTGYDDHDSEAINRRLSARPAHIALGDEMRGTGTLLYAVALLDSADKMVGSVLILEFPSREKLDEWLEIEPYVTQKVWQQIEIQACRVGPSFQRS